MRRIGCWFRGYHWWRTVAYNLRWDLMRCSICGARKRERRTW